MYEIKIKGRNESLFVDDKEGKQIKDMFMDDIKYPDTQKVGIKNWAGVKAEIKSVFGISEKSTVREDEKFTDEDLKIFEKELLPFMEKRTRVDGFEYMYLDNKAMDRFLESKNLCRIDTSERCGFKVTNPEGYLAMRNKISELFNLFSRREYAENIDLIGLEQGINKI